MRFHTLCKVSCYLAVVVSVLALLLSPDVSSTTTVVALVAIGVSWFVEPSRLARARLAAAWNIATLLFLAYQILAVWWGASAIVAGVHFLLFVLINKLFNRRTSRDYQQIQVVSFLMLVAATALNSELTYALCFVGYLLFGTWSFVLLHLRRAIEQNQLLKHAGDEPGRAAATQRVLDSRRIVGARFFAGTSLLSVGLLAGALLIFTFFPRIGFGLFVGPRRGGVTMVGFRDRVELGQHGTLRDNPRVVMRVIVDKRRLPSRPLWRGSALDRYSNGVWSQSPELRGRQIEVRPEGGLFRLNHAPGWPIDLSPSRIRRELLRQEIYRDPLQSNLLFAADRPVAIEVARPKVAGRRALTPLRGPMAEIRGHRIPAAGLRYLAYSAVNPPPARVLRQATKLSEPRLARFLQLPVKIAPRLRRLARQVVAGRPTVYDKVVAVQRYLQRNYSYTLELRHDRRLEPVQEFLFHRRAGHCEYFASAMTLLLRAIGIHARNVNGFAGGIWNDYGGYLAVRQGDAHSWTEVLFSNVGWVAFDATPVTAARPTRTVGGPWGRIEQMIDTLRLRWFRQVVEYDLERQIALIGRLRDAFGAGATARWLTVRRLVWLLALLALASGILVLVRRRWRGLRARVGPSADGRSRSAASVVYQRLLRLLARHGHAKAAGQTPREFARRLQLAQVAGAATVGELTEIYYRARYGQQTPADDERVQLEALLERLQSELARPSSAKE